MSLLKVLVVNIHVDSKDVNEFAEICEISSCAAEVAGLAAAGSSAELRRQG